MIARSLCCACGLCRVPTPLTYKLKWKRLTCPHFSPGENLAEGDGVKMDTASEKENLESASGDCPHCGRPLNSAHAFERRRSPFERRRIPLPDPCQAIVCRVAQLREGAPIEELRTSGLV